MKTRFTFLIAVLLVTSHICAQDFQGEATYKTHRDMDIKMDSTKMTSDMQKQMMDMMKKHFQKTYTLSFNKEASIYKEEVTLETPQAGSSTMSIMGMSGGGSDVLYKNTKSNSFVNQKDTMGKIFLIKDATEKIEWKLESETKFIGEYQCFKATFVKMVPKPRKFSGFSASTDTKTNDEENEEEDLNENEKEPEMIERIVTAWYTPQVPVNNGPAMYQGLPGLILQVQDGKQTIICSKIIINPEDKIKIEAPTKGKEITKTDYDEIMDKKRKEMMERFAPRKGGKSGEAIEIRFGG